MVMLIPFDFKFQWMNTGAFGQTTTLANHTIKLVRSNDYGVRPYVMYIPDDRLMGETMLYVLGYSVEEVQQSFIHCYNMAYMQRICDEALAFRRGRKVSRKSHPENHYKIMETQLCQDEESWLRSFQGLLSIRVISVNAPNLIFKHSGNAISEWQVVNPYEHLLSNDCLYCEECRQIGTLDSLHFKYIRQIGFRCGVCWDHYLDHDKSFYLDRCVERS